ncbi:MAG TPA: NUDIX hydrolase [Acidisarcina sp.]|nr:NUDIX hydrolase [Acidisarcina sp.]
MAKKKAAKTEKPVSLTKKPARNIEVVSSVLSYSGPLFNVHTDMVREPGGTVSRRDVIRHNGSVVMLAVDDSRSKRDPLIIMERQYRHAARQFLWELPAGKMDEGEKPLAAAKRELIEETGYRAKRWTKLVRYFASPGFLGEWMQVFLAEGLSAGIAEPEEDEHIEVKLVPLSEVLSLIDDGQIEDGKTLIAVMLYARKKGLLPKRGAKA